MFPDDRLTYSLASLYLAFVPPGTPVLVFSDSAGTVPADVLREDGTAVTELDPLTVDAYSRVPLFQGPDDDSDTLWVRVSGGLPIAVYARADDRLDALETVTASLSLADDTAALAAPTPGVSAFARLIVAALADQPGLLVRSNPGDTGGTEPFTVEDGFGNKILVVGNFGGLWLNDHFKIGHTLAVGVDPNQWFDIYGYRIQNGLAEFAWPGPPGNMLSFADACQEVFEGTRAGSAGGWAVAFGAAGVPVVETGLPSGMGYAVELTASSTNMSAGTASGVFAYPVTAGGTYSAVIYAKAVGTARSPQVGMQWWNSSAGFISTTVGSAVATNTSTYTKLTSGALTAPAGAAFGAPCVVWPTTVAGERHRISSAAIYPSVETEFSPPFVVQPYPSGGQAKAGDKWRRSSSPADPNKRDYVCTTGGLPHQQVWVSAGSAPLSSATPQAVGSSGAVGTSTSAARDDHVHPGLQLASTSPVADAATAAVGSGTTAAKSDHAHPAASLQVSGSAASVASSGTISTSGLGVSRVTTSGAVTGVIVQSGTVSGQQVLVVNESANTITMAASGTSHVADGTSDVIAATTARLFVWDGGTSLWYRAA